MKEWIERIIEAPLYVYGVLFTIVVTAAVLGMLIPALYASLAAVVVFIVTAVIDAIIHPTLAKAYAFVVIVLAVLAVKSGFNPFEYFAREEKEDQDNIVLRGRSLLPPDYVRRRAAENLREQYRTTRTRRRTL